MADNQYKIELGVKLNTSDLTSDLKDAIAKVDDKHKVKIGVDLKVNDIRERISQYNQNSNNAKLKLGIKLDTDDLNKQIKALNLGGVGGGKGVAIPVNTKSLEDSLGEVKDIIASIHKSLGALDDGNGMKSLLASVNQIADALGKATNESETLVKSLNALASKDFSLNFGIKFGGSNSVNNNAMYGDAVRNQVIPELQRQERELTSYLAKHFNTDEIRALNTLFTKSGNDIGGIGGVIATLDKLNQPVKKGELGLRMQELREYINLVKKSAAELNIDLSPVTSGFEKQADEMVEWANNIRNGVGEAQKSASQFEETMKRAFGGIDAEGLGKVLEPIIADLGEIKRTLQEFSKIKPFEGLTESLEKFDRVLDKLLSNVGSVRDVLNSELNATTNNSTEESIQAQNRLTQASTDTTNTIVQNEQRRQQAIRQTTQLISNAAQESIDNVSSQQISRYFEIDKSSSNDFNDEMDNLVKKWTDNRGSLVDVKINTRTVYDKEAEKNIERLHQAQVTYNNELGETIQKTIAWRKIGEDFDADGKKSPVYGFAEVAGRYSKSIGQTTNQADAFVRQQKQAVSNLTNQINQLNRAAIDQNASKPIKSTSHLDTLSSKYDEITAAIQRMQNASDSNTFVDEQSNVRRLISEYKSLVSEFKNAENVSVRMKGIDLTSGVTIALNDLKKFKADAKDYPQLVSTVNKLTDALNQVEDASSLNKFNDQLRVARSKLASIKTETIAGNRKEKVGINVSGLKSKIADLQTISPEIDKFETEINGAKVTVQSLLNDLKGINTQSDFSVVNSKWRAFTDAAKAAGIAVTETVKKVTFDFDKLKSLAQDRGNLEVKIAGLDTDKNKAEIAALTSQLEGLEAEYDELYRKTEKSLSIGQIRELEQSFEKAGNKIEILNARIEDTSAIKSQTQAYKELLSIQKQIGSLELDIAKLDGQGGNNNQIKELESQLKGLRETYLKISETMDTPLSTDQWNSICAQVAKTQNELALLDAKVADTKSKLASDISLDFGTFETEVLSLENNIGKLSNKSANLVTGVELLKKHLASMKNASDDDELIASAEKYKLQLKEVENQLKQNQIAEQKANDAARLKQEKEKFSLQMGNWLKDNSAAAKDFGGRIRELQAKIDACDSKQLNGLKREFQIIKQEAKEAGKTTQTLGDKLKTQFSKYSAYFGVAEIFMYAEQGLRDMFEQVKLIDSAMTELKKVTNETDASYNKFLSNAAKRSKELGTTIDGLVSSTADFARLGYGFKDAQGLAEVANIYAVVGDEINGVEGATESLISTMAAFKDEMNGMSNSDFAMSIVDKFNEIGNNFAISSGGIGEALERSASSLMAANNTIDESIALITAANTVVQDPEAVGEWLADIKSGYIG